MNIHCRKVDVNIGRHQIDALYNLKGDFYEEDLPANSTGNHAHFNMRM